MFRSAYDSDNTVISPQGRLFQVREREGGVGCGAAPASSLPQLLLSIRLG